MPIAVGFAEPDMFIIHASGDVTYAECQRGIDDIMAHPRSPRTRKVLVDARAVESAPETSQLRALARELKPLIDRGLGPMAIVTDTAFVYGVARMFAVFAEVFGMHVRAFRTFEEGERWLAERPNTVTDATS